MYMIHLYIVHPLRLHPPKVILHHHNNQTFFSYPSIAHNNLVHLLWCHILSYGWMHTSLYYGIQMDLFQMKISPVYPWKVASTPCAIFLDFNPPFGIVLSAEKPKRYGESWALPYVQKKPSSHREVEIRTQKMVSRQPTMACHSASYSLVAFFDKFNLVFGYES